ncbi:uncharacterized protein LOC143187564 isoform X1 [Calliopsis andreniformis]|uniref:uncharacterized protein LOC143187564 isoform X1 n=1 Tax=Calliopsis andreniformis TaxID=337506 RepID=UPI003FCDB4EE
MVIPILHTRVIDICKISHIRENINILSTSKRRTQNAGFQCCVVIPCRIIYCELTLHGWTLDTLAGGWSYFVPAPTHGPRPGPAWTCLDLLELWPPLTLFNLHPSVFVYGLPLPPESFSRRWKKSGWKEKTYLRQAQGCIVDVDVDVKVGVRIEVWEQILITRIRVADKNIFTQNQKCLENK